MDTVIPSPPSLSIPSSPLPPTCTTDDPAALRAEVYACVACDSLPHGIRFTRPSPTAPFFKFPPVIGRQRDAEILFVGINPRLSPSNRALHHQLMADSAAFAALAGNRVAGCPYIGRGGIELHYNAHVSIVEAAFPGRAFEEVAAVTELFHCATKNADGLPARRSPCARLFLERVIALVRPCVIVAAGATVKGYFRSQWGLGPEGLRVRVGDQDVPVVTMPHPRDWLPKKAERMERAIAAVIAFLAGAPVPGCTQFAEVEDEKHRTNPETGSVERCCLPSAGIEGMRHVVRTRDCNWSPKYGWKPKHAPADLDVLDTHPGMVVRYQLFRDGKLRYLLEMTAEDLRCALGTYVDGETWRRNGYVVSITRTVSRLPTEEFIDRWAPYVRATR